MTHTLKIWPQYYTRVASGSKTFEYRKNDRGFQPDDTVILREYDPNELVIGGDYERDTYGDYTSSPKLTFKVGYVLPVENDMVIFSLINC